MKNKIRPFATNNSGNQWVLTVNNYFGYVTEAQKDEFLREYGEECCEDTPFGSWGILPPKTIRNHASEDFKDFFAIDIINYYKTREERQSRRPFVPYTLHQRLEVFKISKKGLFSF